MLGIQTPQHPKKSARCLCPALTCGCRGSALMKVEIYVGGGGAQGLIGNRGIGDAV